MTGDDPFYDRDPITGAAAIRIAVLSACAWGLVYMLVWAAVIVAPFVWRLVEPLLTVLAVGLALVVIILGIGTSG